MTRLPAAAAVVVVAALCVADAEEAEEAWDEVVVAIVDEPVADEPVVVEWAEPVEDDAVAAAEDADADEAVDAVDALDAAAELAELAEELRAATTELALPVGLTVEALTDEVGAPRVTSAVEEATVLVLSMTK